jgi:putative membrane protein
MIEVWGTLAGRWFVTLFAFAYLILGLKVLGGRKLALFTVAAFVLAAASENASVHFGFPYTHYTFNQALRGTELWILDVPIFVPLSYTFVMFFSFCAARVVAAGPWSRVPPSRWGAYLLSVLFATWSTWTLDPVAQRGERWYLGDLFHYREPGFWFGLPLSSQVGWFLVSALLCGLLAWMTWHTGQRSERPLRNPLVWCLVVFVVQVLHLSIVAFVIGEPTLCAAGLLIWTPAAAITWVFWSQLGRQGSARGRPLPPRADRSAERAGRGEA